MDSKNIIENKDRAVKDRVSLTYGGKVVYRSNSRLVEYGLRIAVVASMWGFVYTCYKIPSYFLDDRTNGVAGVSGLSFGLYQLYWFIKQNVTFNFSEFIQ